MKSFRRMVFTVLVVIAGIFLIANLLLWKDKNSDSGRPYRVEINRIALEIEQNGFEALDLSGYQYVTQVERYAEERYHKEVDEEEGAHDGVQDMDEFFGVESDYVIREIAGDLYRFDYTVLGQTGQENVGLIVNVCLGSMALILLAVFLYIRQKILHPFHRLSEVPYELSKGNLTAPLTENRSRFFGRFIWGVDLLRENMEQQKQRELALHKEKKTLLLSLSHDIKTPLSAIKLYAKALSKGLYAEKEKQLEIAENINKKADEIEGYVSQIISASKEDFLSFDVTMGEFYLSELVRHISGYYSEKLALIKTIFSVEKYSDCILKGDFDRSIEVLQNVMENAIKYGDGKQIEVGFSEEDGCVLISVANSGCELSDTELPHIFESFWRGANVGAMPGSGLGLYIGRQLMHKMNGEIFAEIKDGFMIVTTVFGKA